MGALSVAVHARDLLKEVTIILARAAAMVHIATPRPRSGAEAGKTPCLRGGQEELPHVRGQGQWPRVPGYDGAGTAEKSYLVSEVRATAERSYPASEVRGHGREELPHAPTPKARGGGREEQPHVQRAVAARAQEGLEKLSYVENQEGWR